MNNFNKIFVLLIILVLTINLKTSSAHGELKKMTNDIGNYIVEVAYDEIDLEINGSTRISFSLIDKNSEKSPQFDRIIATISKDQQVLFKGPISNQEDILPSITYQFPSSGNYQISANFQKGEDSITQSAFTLEVPQIEPTSQEKTVSNSSRIVLITISLLIGSIIGLIPSLIYIFGKKKSTAKQ